MWILSKIRAWKCWKCEFNEKSRFKIAKKKKKMWIFVENEAFKLRGMWILSKIRV